MKSLLLAATALLPLAFAAPASANIITITGYDGFTTVSNSASSPTSFGPTTIGTWTVSGLATGTPPLDQGTLFSNTISAKSGGSGTLFLWVTETGLSAPPASISFLSSLTSNLLFGKISGVQMITSIQFDDSIPGPLVPLGTILDDHSFTSTGLQELTKTIDLDGLYSMTELYVIHATGAGGANLTADVTATVDEPAAIGLLGLGALAIIGLARRGRDVGAAA